MISFKLIYATDFPPLSFESANNLCRKSDTIRGSPSRRDTEGCHPRSSLALEMSGFLLCGSSSVFGLNSIFAFGSMVSCTTCTNQTLQQLLSSSIYFYYYYYYYANHTQNIIPEPVQAWWIHQGSLDWMDQRAHLPSAALNLLPAIDCIMKLGSCLRSSKCSYASWLEATFPNNVFQQHLNMILYIFNFFAPYFFFLHIHVLKIAQWYLE